VIRIFELAIIIKAAMKILRMINVDDRESMDEKDEIDMFT